VTVPAPRTSLVIAVIAALWASPASAEIPDLVWDPPEVVDSSVTSLSSAASNQAIYLNNHWTVVYEKDGRVWFTSHGTSGWSSPTAVTSADVPSRNPHVADGSDYGAIRLIVTWEDDRRGHSEIWSRRFEGTQWAPEECLSDDGTASGASAITYAGGCGAFVVWEDSTGTSSRVRGREYSGGAWRAVEDISTSPANGREPTVGCESMICRYHVAWTDYRTGTPRLMYRSRMAGGGWSNETPLAPGRRPSIDVQNCCGDVFGIASFLLVYEASGTAGATESRGLCYMDGSGPTFPLSPDDGIPSIRPHATGFDFTGYWCNWLGGAEPKYYGTWTDLHAPGSNILGISEGCFSRDGQEVLSVRGLDRCGAAARPGYPVAEMLAYWIEEINGVPALIARLGHMPGCARVTVQAPPALVIAPEGDPPTIVHAVDHCGEIPVPNLPVTITFDNALAAALTWDPTQSHPDVDATTNANGDAIFAIRGGGCSQAGTATVTCDHAMPLDDWSGAKSPDIDGDCVVRSDDVDYVRARLETADFCADLDGSGRVDAADLAIVIAALGDHCRGVTDVVDGGGLTGRPSLTASPNPATSGSLLRLESPRAGLGSIAIFDAAGRLVRAYGALHGESGVTVIEWDGRTSAGRQVPSGIYFAVARIDGITLRRAIVVTR